MTIEQKPGQKGPDGPGSAFPCISEILPQKYPFLFIDRVLENRQKPVNDQVPEEYHC